MSKAARAELEMCESCRSPQPAPLQRVTVERVEVRICRESGPCIKRARASGIWMLREVL